MKRGLSGLEVGNTPLLKVDGIFAKLECTNPLGSIKDRMAKYIIEESEKQGLLRRGMTIVEASSGNTGIALSYFAKEKGYPIIIIMPENMTEERKRILKKLGAQLVLCSEGNFVEAMRIRDEIVREPMHFNPDQFSNLLNLECHYKTTAQEILDQMRVHSKRIDAFVSGVGTGGTLIGCGKRLREVFPTVKIIAVEPSESPIMSGGKPGRHGIQGIGDGFVPALASDGKGGLNSLIDQVMCVSTTEAKAAASYLAEAKGMCVGISSGANFVAAKRTAADCETVVTVFPDGFSKYKSQGLTRIGAGPCPHQKECNCPFKEQCVGNTTIAECKCG
jgi:cysteine synthase A